jgi:phosphoglycerol transferase
MHKKHHFILFYSTIVLLFSGIVLFLCAKYFIEQSVYLLIGFIVSLVLLGLLKFLPVKAGYKRDRKNGSLLAGTALYFIALSILFLKRFSLERFPINDPEMVLSGITNVHGAIDRGIYYDIFTALAYALALTLVFFCLVFFYQKKTKHFYSVSRLPFKVHSNRFFLLFGLIILICSLADTYHDLRLYEYRKVIQKLYAEPVDSDFYRNEYVTPDTSLIKFPEKKRNLVFILLESMESSYADKQNGGLFEKNLIPNLTKLSEENINFSNTDKLGGGLDLSGTGWTVAAMTSKFSGLPFNLIGDENLSRRESFLPNAVTLTNLLADEGYKQLYIFGTDKKFAGRDLLLETHGNVEIHDIIWYKENGYVPKDYFKFWGLEDIELYKLAKMELDKLGKSEQPFMFGMLTIDTHMPFGLQYENCGTPNEIPMRQSISCADDLLMDLIDWIKQQPWYEETTIAIMGDHLFMATEKTNFFGDNKYLALKEKKKDLFSIANNPRRWLDIFINAKPANSDYESRIKNRAFSSFDMFPTMLAAMGCTIKDERLGFGVNLFSNEKTLCERLPEDSINYKLMERNHQYLYLEGTEPKQEK